MLRLYLEQYPFLLPIEVDHFTLEVEQVNDSWCLFCKREYPLPQIVQKIGVYASKEDAEKEIELFEKNKPIDGGYYHFN